MSKKEQEKEQEKGKGKEKEKGAKKKPLARPTEDTMTPPAPPIGAMPAGGQRLNPAPHQQGQIAQFGALMGMQPALQHFIHQTGQLGMQQLQYPQPPHVQQVQPQPPVHQFMNHQPMPGVPVAIPANILQPPNVPQRPISAEVAYIKQNQNTHRSATHRTASTAALNLKKKIVDLLNFTAPQSAQLSSQPSNNSSSSSSSSSMNANTSDNDLEEIKKYPLDGKLVASTFEGIWAYYKKRFQNESEKFIQSLAEIKIPEDQLKKIITTIERNNLKNQELGRKGGYITTSFIMKSQDDDHFHVFRGIALLLGSTYVDEYSGISLRELVTLVWKTIEFGLGLKYNEEEHPEKFQSDLKDVNFYEALKQISRGDSGDGTRPCSRGEFNLIIECLDKAHRNVEICRVTKTDIPDMIKAFYESKFEQSSEKTKLGICQSIVEKAPDPGADPLEMLLKHANWHEEFKRSMQQYIQATAFSEKDIHDNFAAFIGLDNILLFPKIKAYYDYFIKNRVVISLSGSTSSSSLSLVTPQRKEKEKEKEKEREQKSNPTIQMDDMDNVAMPTMQDYAALLEETPKTPSKPKETTLPNSQPSLKRKLSHENKESKEESKTDSADKVSQQALRKVSVLVDNHKRPKNTVSMETIKEKAEQAVKIISMLRPESGNQSELEIACNVYIKNINSAKTPEMITKILRLVRDRLNSSDHVLHKNTTDELRKATLMEIDSFLNPKEPETLTFS